MRVSIHAPVKGATRPIPASPLTAVSIHAPVKGATPAVQVLRIMRCFNPRAREGRDQRPLNGDIAQRVSIHAPVKGATQPIGNCISHDLVSIHAPVKGATMSSR